jgi:uncharacterized membrane protein YfcA
MDLLQYAIIIIASAAAGMVNALAGGGTLITFPTLLSLGLPAISANVTNTVALVPGYLGATIAQWEDLHDQKQRLWWFIPAGLVGGMVGGLLLLNSGEKLFRALVPYLILIASGLLAIQDPVRGMIQQRVRRNGSNHGLEFWTLFPIGTAGVYGGYFGAGLSVIVLAVLGLTQNDSLTRLNAVKQAIALAVNIAAAILFLFSGHVIWITALVMAFGALAGGVIGGRLSSRIKPGTLRWIVVCIGTIVGLVYLMRDS